MTPQYAIFTDEFEFIHFCRLLQELHTPTLTLDDVKNTPYFQNVSPKEKERLEALLRNKIFPNDFPDAQSEWLKVCLGF